MKALLWLLVVLLTLSLAYAGDCDNLEGVDNNHGYALAYLNAYSFSPVYGEGNADVPICSNSNTKSFGRGNYYYYYDDDNDCQYINGKDGNGNPIVGLQNYLRNICSYDNSYLFLDLIHFDVEELYYINDVGVGGDLKASKTNSWLEWEEHDPNADTQFGKVWSTQSVTMNGKILSSPYYLHDEHDLPLDFGCLNYYLVDNPKVGGENDPMIADCDKGKSSITPGKDNNEFCYHKEITNDKGNKNDFWFKAEYVPPSNVANEGGSDYRVLKKYTIKFQDYTPKTGLMDFALVCKDRKYADDEKKLCYDITGKANPWIDDGKPGYDFDGNNKCCEDKDKGVENGGYICTDSGWEGESASCSQYMDKFNSYKGLYSSSTGSDGCCGDDNTEGEFDNNAVHCTGTSLTTCADLNKDECSYVKGCTKNTQCTGTIACGWGDCLKGKEGCYWKEQVERICAIKDGFYYGDENFCLKALTNECSFNEGGTTIYGYRDSNGYCLRGQSATCVARSCDYYNNNEGGCNSAGCSYSFECTGTTSCEDQDTEKGCGLLGCQYSEGTGDMGYVSNSFTGFEGQYLCYYGTGGWKWIDAKASQQNPIGYSIVSIKDGAKNVDFIANYPESKKIDNNECSGTGVIDDSKLTWSKCDRNGLISHYSGDDMSDGKTLGDLGSPTYSACTLSSYHNNNNAFICFKENDDSSKILECSSDESHTINGNRARFYGDSVYSLAYFDNSNNIMKTEKSGDSRIKFNPQENLKVGADDYLVFDYKGDELPASITIEANGEEYVVYNPQPLEKSKDYMHFVIRMDEFKKNQNT